jgi:hypothetical protein
MSFLKGLGSAVVAMFTPGGGKDSVIGKGLEIVDQMTTNGDLRAELSTQMYIAELNARTIPIIDALHKMGRQILAYGQMAFYAYCLHKNIPITWELVAGVSGVASAYTMVKGKGNLNT